MNQNSISFCVSGNGELAKSAIEYSESLNFNPRLVVITNSTSLEFQNWLKNKKIEFVCLPDDKSRSNRDLIRIFKDTHQSNWLLTFNRIIPDKALGYVHEDCCVLNTHLSLLPSFAGLNSLERTIRSGVRYAGATIHKVDSGVDTGFIVSQCIIEIGKILTAIDLGKKLFPLLLAMYLQVVSYISENRLETIKYEKEAVIRAKFSCGAVSPSIENNVLSILERMGYSCQPAQ